MIKLQISLGISVITSGFGPEKRRSTRLGKTINLTLRVNSKVQPARNLSMSETIEKTMSINIRVRRRLIDF